MIQEAGNKISWKTVLAQAFSEKQLQNAQISHFGRLTEELVAVRRFSRIFHWKLRQLEIYDGPLGLTARVYFRGTKMENGQRFIPSYVVGTQNALQQMQRSDTSLSSDPPVEHGVLSASYGKVHLRRIAGRRLRKQMEELLDQDNLAFAKRHTTHIYDRHDRTIQLEDGQEAVVRMFRDEVRPKSGRYTALVFRKDGSPLVPASTRKDRIGVLSVTNDQMSVKKRPNMGWEHLV